ncbi:hypothetical protein [Calothrix sp. UHCC 0171]|uniref:hypothetical protein n=1 Tax=Calothrix sp. UHCC 0171 TaxID=3110245 RepID=UPI002B203CA5|nr:hypothetical protein [Calothrix sp. UHCC 0171]MEA5570065.1 hypothetical protein [Calothrix sp. UHCC 0171]
MAVARKSDVNNSTKAGWFGGRRSRLRANSRTSVSIGGSGNIRSPMTSTSIPKRKLNQVQPRTQPQKSETQGKNSSTIPVMSALEAMPAWLLRLHQLQRQTAVVSFVLVMATLIAYGWTVYSQQLWGKSYRRLQNLQRHERQLTITNGVLKSKMAADAEQPNAGLVSPSPAGTIFLQVAPGTTNSVNSLSPNEPNHVTPREQKSIPGY